jgi:hypothetical protein
MNDQMKRDADEERESAGGDILLVSTPKDEEIIWKISQVGSVHVGVVKCPRWLCACVLVLVAVLAVIMLVVDNIREGQIVIECVRNAKPTLVEEEQSGTEVLANMTEDGFSCYERQEDWFTGGVNKEVKLAGTGGDGYMLRNASEAYHAGYKTWNASELEAYGYKTWNASEIAAYGSYKTSDQVAWNASDLDASEQDASGQEAGHGRRLVPDTTYLGCEPFSSEPCNLIRMFVFCQCMNPPSYSLVYPSMLCTTGVTRGCTPWDYTNSVYFPYEPGYSEMWQCYCLQRTELVTREVRLAFSYYEEFYSTYTGNIPSDRVVKKTLRQRNRFMVQTRAPPLPGN